MLEEAHHSASETGGFRLLICDLDGTLLNNLQRVDKLPPIGASRADEWREFNCACLGDRPVAYRVAILQLLAPHYQLMYLTSRGRAAMEPTRASLTAIGAPTAPLWMRDEEDHRTAADFKEAEIARLLLAFHKRPADLVLLDDDHLVCQRIAIAFPGCTVIQVPSHDASYLRRHGLMETPVGHISLDKEQLADSLAMHTGILSSRVQGVAE